MSIRSRCTWAKKPWWALNRPVNASANSALVAFSRPSPSPANTSGSRSPAISASIIRRPDNPLMSLITDDSFNAADSNSFSIRWTSSPRNRTKVVRVRTRSFNSLISRSGTNEPRTSPCAARSASHTASATSVLRPGI